MTSVTIPLRWPTVADKYFQRSITFPQWTSGPLPEKKRISKQDSKTNYKM